MVFNTSNALRKNQCWISKKDLSGFVFKYSFLFYSNFARRIMAILQYMHKSMLKLLNPYLSMRERSI